MYPIGTSSPLYRLIHAWEEKGERTAFSTQLFAINWTLYWTCKHFWDAALIFHWMCIWCLGFAVTQTLTLCGCWIQMNKWMPAHIRKVHSRHSTILIKKFTTDFYLFIYLTNQRQHLKQFVTNLCSWRCFPTAVGTWLVSASRWGRCPLTVIFGTAAYSQPPWKKKKTAVDCIYSCYATSKIIYENISQINQLNQCNNSNLPMNQLKRKDNYSGAMSLLLYQVSRFFKILLNSLYNPYVVILTLFADCLPTTPAPAWTTDCKAVHVYTSIKALKRGSFFCLFLILTRVHDWWLQKRDVSFWNHSPSEPLNCKRV